MGFSKVLVGSLIGFRGFRGILGFIDVKVRWILKRIDYKVHVNNLKVAYVKKKFKYRI